MFELLKFSPYRAILEIGKTSKSRLECARYRRMEQAVLKLSIRLIVVGYLVNYCLDNWSALHGCLKIDLVLRPIHKKTLKNNCYGHYRNPS